MCIQPHLVSLSLQELLVDRPKLAQFPLFCLRTELLTVLLKQFDLVLLLVFGLQIVIVDIVVSLVQIGLPNNRLVEINDRLLLTLLVLRGTNL